VSKPRGDRELGDKLGPKLVSLVTTATLAARRGLADHEARVHAAGVQQVIDRAGHEVADLYRPLLVPYLADDAANPAIRDFLSRAASGTHQWQAIAGLAVGASGAPNALSQIFSNELAPLVYDTVETNPHLIPDIGTITGLAARGLIGPDVAQHSGRQLGFTGGWTSALTLAAQTAPGLGELLELLRRGQMSWQDVAGWLERAGINEHLWSPLISLRRTLLSPADAALAVLRGTISDHAGLSIAEQNGLTESDFGILIGNTGEPLGLMQLLEAYRRGFISEETLKRGVLQSRVRDEWFGTALKLAFSPISTADAIDAAQRGHISEDTAAAIARQNGVEPAQIPILVANAGNPPAPEQLLELWRRGRINEHQVNTGLLEGRTKDAWIPQIKDLRYQPISTADAVDAWVRGHIDQATADRIIIENGTEPDQAVILRDNAGNPPALMQLLEAYRRGFIGQAALETGIRESRYRDEWLPTFLKLRFSPMSTADAVDAALQGELTVEAARDKARQNGLEPEDFDPLYKTAGEPLARTELQQLFNRDLISMGQFQQGLRESRLKDKYVPLATELHTRLLAPRDVTELVSEGVMSAAVGLAKLRQLGYAKDDAAALITLAADRATGNHKQLATGQTQKLYADRIIDHATAVSLLEQLHWTATDAAMLLRLADYQAEEEIFRSGISAIRNQFVNGRADSTDATADLLGLGLPQPSVARYLQLWKLEKGMVTKHLSVAQIIKAMKLGLLVKQEQLTTAQWETANQKAAHERLTALGYGSTDAQLLIDGA
jgi:hypothetical protein